MSKVQNIDNENEMKNLVEFDDEGDDDNYDNQEDMTKRNEVARRKSLEKKLFQQQESEFTKSEFGPDLLDKINEYELENNNEDEKNEDEECEVSIIHQPHHVVTSRKLVPVIPLTILSGVVIVLNLVIMMIFVDLLARGANFATTYFGIWGPAVVIILAAGVFLIYIYGKSTIVFGIFIAIIINIVGALVQSMIAVSLAKDCSDTSICTKYYVGTAYTIIFVCGLISLFFLFALLFVIQFKVKRIEECREVCSPSAIKEHENRVSLRNITKSWKLNP